MVFLELNSDDAKKHGLKTVVGVVIYIESLLQKTFKILYCNYSLLILSN